MERLGKCADCKLATLVKTGEPYEDPDGGISIRLGPDIIVRHCSLRTIVNVRAACVTKEFEPKENSDPVAETI